MTKENENTTAEAALPPATGSALSVCDAITILEMAGVCYSEGIGPDFSKLLETIAVQHPQLVVEFSDLDWLNHKTEERGSDASATDENGGQP